MFSDFQLYIRFEAFRGRLLLLQRPGMTRFVRAVDRHQVGLLPDWLDDYVSHNNPACVVDAFVDELDLATLGFAGVRPPRPADRAIIPRRC